YLDSGSVVDDLCVRTRDKAVQVLAERAAALQDAAGVNEILGGVMKREIEYGTALGEGVAIPHVYIEGLKEPVLVYGRCADGIEWNAPDGQRVNHVFLLVSPSGTEDIHVRTLASIAKAMQSPANRERLVRAAGASSLFGELQILLR
ncbi:MAG TPA: PTS sugar transporter subunit IIA, partial [Candidatus Krumholzibacterium sp.]|nr:PTS sugar transporter subunit IIA [Candidatus Krumholzibacterium sp.]